MSDFYSVGVPQPCLRLNKLAAGVVVAVSSTTFFPEGMFFFTETFLYLVILRYLMAMHTFENKKKTPNTKTLASFFLNFRINPIGDQNDVQKLSISANIFVYILCIWYCAYIRYCCVRTKRLAHLEKVYHGPNKQ